MVRKIDLLFGELINRMGFATPKQIQECLKIQEGLPNWRPLGIILKEKGYLSSDQLKSVIDIQRRNMEAMAIQQRQVKEDNLFGRLAIRLGFIAEKKVDECLGVQLTMMDDYFLRLGEIMVKKGYLTKKQVQKVLDYQESQTIKCSCGTKYNVILYNPGAKFFCYKCEKELTIPSIPKE